MRFRAFTTLLLMLALAVIGSAQKREPVDGVKYFDETKRWYNEFTEHWFQFFDISEEEIRNSIIHWEQIGEDLKNSTDSAEGTYGNGGETHGDFLRWSEKSGFVWLNVNKCAGGPMRITRGRVVSTGFSVKFIPEKVLESSLKHGNHAHKLSAEFLPVKWRKADFLVQRASIADFANFAAGLNSESSGYYDEGRYFSKVLQDYQGSANELPIFPIGYESYVKKPLKATIVSIGKSYRRPKSKEFDDAGKLIEQNYDDLVTEVKIDLGMASGLLPGTFIRFIHEGDDYTVDGIVIKKILQGFSLCEFTTDIPKKNCRKSEYESCESEPGRILKIGQKLSTTGEW